jgi:DNA mismatch repair protein MutS2
MLALRTLEFDRIVEVVSGLALTPLGAEALAALEPATDPKVVAAALNATGETTAYLESNALFPLRAGSGLDEALDALGVAGQILDPLPLSVADFLIRYNETPFGGQACFHPRPHVARAAASGADRRRRDAIDPGGEVLDRASPLLRRVRDDLRQKRQWLRTTLDQFVRGKDTSKYLQEQVVTERNGRYVLMVRSEHRGNVPGIVHGSSASGASLFLEPSATVEINNDIVELEEREREEIRRILLELTDAFRARPADLRASLDVAVDLDVLQAKARFGSIVNGVAPEIAIDGRLELREARHPLLIGAVRRRLEDAGEGGDVIPIDVIVDPPARVLLITGPNTGGKTVALKTAGLLSLMAQAGTCPPAWPAAGVPIGSRISATSSRSPQA